MGFSESIIYSFERGKEIFGEKAASKKIFTKFLHVFFGINILMQAIC